MQTVLDADNLAQGNYWVVVDGYSTRAGAFSMSMAPVITQWFGTAPFYRGQCPSGWTQLGRNNRGDGGRCWWGTKAYCRRVVEV